MAVAQMEHKSVERTRLVTPWQFVSEENGVLAGKLGWNTALARVNHQLNFITLSQIRKEFRRIVGNA